ncbi:hypothetical protein IAT40_001281 [Kwoniella sp. CBS 6097]
MSGPLGNLPGMAFDPVRNRYFPIPKVSAHNPNQTEEDTRPRPASASAPGYRPNMGSRGGPSSSAYPGGQSRQPPISSSSSSSSSRNPQAQPQPRAPYNFQLRASSRSTSGDNPSRYPDSAGIDPRYQYTRRQGNRNIPAGVHPAPSAPIYRTNDSGARGSERPSISITLPVPSAVRRNATADPNPNANSNFNSSANVIPIPDPNANLRPSQNRRQESGQTPRMRSFEDVTSGRSRSGPGSGSGCYPSDPHDDIYGQKAGGKRGRSSESSQSGYKATGGSERVSRIRKGRLGVKYGGGGGGGLYESDRHVKAQISALSDLQLNQVHHACECRGELITSYKSSGDEAYYATTDHGTMIIHSSAGRTSAFNVCAEKLVGVHCDVPRLVMMAIAGGPEPHLHLFKRDPEMLDHVFMTHSELDLNRAEIYGLSSFDDVCTLGSTKSISTISYSSYLGSKNRKLPSDALTVHQSSRDLVFVGQRNGSVGLEDLRTPPTPSAIMQNVVAQTTNRKAIVGVKRLDDAAVPWGLAVSGMGHELMIFDIRYNAQPLRRFEGHFNTFHTQVAMTTSPDDKIIVASGSDRRIRAWSTLTAEPIFPPYSQPTISPPSSPGRERQKGRGYGGHRNDSGSGGVLGEEGDAWDQKWQESELDNPLYGVFENKITHLSVTEGMGLDVVHKGELMRFGRK